MPKTYKQIPSNIDDMECDFYEDFTYPEEIDIED